MRRKRFILPCLMLLVAAGPVLAEEIIYFTNGTSMPIRAHEVRGEMIHVDLGSDAFMAFPLHMVDKIENAGKDVVLTPSFSAGNKIAPSVNPNSNGSYPVRGRAPSRYSDAKEKLPIGQVKRPMTSHAAENRRGLGVSGRRDLNQKRPGRTEGGYIGTERSGSRNVIGGKSSRTSMSGKPTTKAKPFTVVNRGTVSNNSNKKKAKSGGSGN